MHVRTSRLVMITLAFTALAGVWVGAGLASPARPPSLGSEPIRLPGPAGSAAGGVEASDPSRTPSGPSTSTTGSAAPGAPATPAPAPGAVRGAAPVPAAEPPTAGDPGDDPDDADDADDPDDASDPSDP